MKPGTIQPVIWMMVAMFAALVLLTFFTNRPVNALRFGWTGLTAVLFLQVVSSLLVLGDGDNVFDIQVALDGARWAILAWAILRLGLANSPEDKALQPRQPSA